VTRLDWLALALIALTALNGLRRGLLAGLLGLAGIVVGAIAGAKLAPQLLAGDESPWTPLVALAGAVLLATFLQSVGALAGGALRTSLLVVPPLRLVDTAGGVVLGAVAGVALVWVAGAVALHVPGQTRLREVVQRSRILRELNGRVPPARLLDAIERVDPFLQIPGPLARVDPPDPRLLRDPGVRAARGSVLRVTGTACGLAVSGSGWIARPEVVVTNAHVVAGVDDARVDRGDGRRLDARVVAFDPRNDVAILRVPGLDGAPLQLVEPERGTAVAILGYPQSGPFTATAGRVGQTGTVFTDDAYGRGPVSRSITTVRGEIRRGNSGGPAVDSQGRVQTTIFASRVGSASGFGVPTRIVRRAVEGARAQAVSTGPCVVR
jgi:S1-C subfamily serine protease